MHSFSTTGRMWVRPGTAMARVTSASKSLLAITGPLLFHQMAIAAYTAQVPAGGG